MCQYVGGLKRILARKRKQKHLMNRIQSHVYFVTPSRCDLLRFHDEIKLSSENVGVSSHECHRIKQVLMELYIRCRKKVVTFAYVLDKTEVSMRICSLVNLAKQHILYIFWAYVDGQRANVKPLIRVLIYGPKIG